VKLSSVIVEEIMYRKALIFKEFLSGESMERINNGLVGINGFFEVKKDK
jgi:hypothetical protein